MTTYEYNKNCNLNKLTRELIDYPLSHLTAEPGKTYVHMNLELSLEEQSDLNTLITAHNPVDMLEIVNQKRIKAIQQFNILVGDFINENILLGITTAGKTKLIQDTLQPAINYGRAGSLYEVRNAIDEIVCTPEMAPFLTDERKAVYLARIDEILAAL